MHQLRLPMAKLDKDSVTVSHVQVRVDANLKQHWPRHNIQSCATESRCFSRQFLKFCFCTTTRSEADRVTVPGLVSQANTLSVIPCEKVRAAAKHTGTSHVPTAALQLEESGFNLKSQGSLRGL
eukprot:3514667-Rhodomonas_salina.1